MTDLERENLGLGERPALLVVDMIKGFTDASCPLGCDCPEVVAANAQLIDAFHAADLPVVFTTVVYHNEGQARVFRDRINALNVLTPDSDWVQVDARLDIRKDDILLEKQWASAFHKTELDAQLRALGVDSLVVTGLTTSGCVRATAVDGLQYDYRVVVPREAVGDRNPDAHEANLFDLHAKYADVVAVADVLENL
ncbi:Maleamate amidohydrolase [Halioglobus japonicus]|nr:Maleamate amidohydrolase [Halioglobus japonicus]